MKDEEKSCDIVYLSISKRNKDLPLYSDFIEEQKILEKEKNEEEERKKRKKKGCICCLIITSILIGILLLIGLFTYIVTCCGCFRSDNSSIGSSSNKGIFGILAIKSTTTAVIHN